MKTSWWMGCAALGLAQVSLALADESHFEKTVPADARGVVEISNVSGSVTVSGWDSAQVEVKGELGEGVRRVDVTNESGRTSIKVILPNQHVSSGSADLHIRVPRGSELDISGVSADVTASDVEGAQNIKTISGNIKADVYQRDAEYKTVSGDIMLKGRSKTPSDGVHLSTISGNVRVDHVGGDLEGTAVSGDIHLHLDPAHSVRVRTTSGDLGLEGTLAKSGSVDAESISGGVSVHLTPEGRMDYEAATFSGDIRNCMRKEVERTSQYAPGRRLNGSSGNGDGARVRIKTMSGDVDLCDKG